MDDRYYDNLQRVNPGYGKPRFSKKEIMDITASVIVLAVAFTILYRRSSILNYFEYYMGDSKYVGLFAMCFVLVVVSFLFHEFGHKFVAQKYGLWSEFRMWPLGLVLTLFTSLFGFLFASPGAVYITGQVNTESNAKISIAGPAVNIAMSAVGILGCLLCNHSGWVIFFYMLGQLNAFLAVFNLIPVPPLDGSKILPWNKILWAAVMVISVLELLYMLFWIPDLYWA